MQMIPLTRLENIQIWARMWNIQQVHVCEIESLCSSINTLLFKIGVVTDSNCGNKLSISTQAGPTDFSIVTTQTDADTFSVSPIQAEPVFSEKS